MTPPTKVTTVPLDTLGGGATVVPAGFNSSVSLVTGSGALLNFCLLLLTDSTLGVAESSEGIRGFLTGDELLLFEGGEFEGMLF